MDSHADMTAHHNGFPPEACRDGGVVKARQRPGVRWQRGKGNALPRRHRSAWISEALMNE
ncbi:hypothetical protein [Prosthecobacter debontii]|uniref:hypothetical protein n=1 Tax=Prosthecobacter debontii TaxID=48467 RepID=UPI001116A232|nr:hypothetical protein [Prosthecobacter debontii]